MKKATEIGTELKDTILLVGPSGSGKTTLAANAARYAEYAPMEIWDMDLRFDGVIPLLDEECIGNIHVEQYVDKSNPGKIYDTVLARIGFLERAFKGQVPKPEMMPKTIFLDSWSFFGNIVLDMVVDYDRSYETLKLKKSFDERYGPLPIAARDHYGPQMQYLTRALQLLLALPCNVIVSAHEDTQKDEFTNVLKKGIDTTGKFANRMPCYFGDYWRTRAEVNPVTRILSFAVYTQPGEDFDARTKWPKILGTRETQETIWSKIVAAKRHKT